jgi:prevent-host-death family protein
MHMRQIAAAKFKTHCLTLMEDVRSTREPLIITKRGKPVAKLVPADGPKREFIGSLKGIIRIVGDIESPVVPPEDWESAR